MAERSIAWLTRTTDESGTAESKRTVTGCTTAVAALGQRRLLVLGLTHASQ